MALGTDINKTYESVLDEALVADNYYTEEYPLKEIYNDLKNIKPTDAKALLGEGGFLTIALNAAIAELTDEPKPDVETCLKITDLSVTIIILLHNAGVDIESAEKLRATLHDKINAYNKMTRNKIGAEIYLNKILEKGTLGYEDLYNLFLNTDYGVAASMIREYNKDTKNPVNAIKVLVVEKLRRRFESMSNEAGVSDLISSQIIKCDLFKTDSKDYKAWESVVNDIKEKDLKPRTAEEKEQLDEYKEDLKLIYEFKVKQ